MNMYIDKSNDSHYFIRAKMMVKIKSSGVFFCFDTQRTDGWSIDDELRC